MTRNAQDAHPIGTDALLALAAGKVREPEAQAALYHIQTCARCSALFTQAKALQRQAAELRHAEVDEVTRRRIWRTLRHEAKAAAARSQRRHAFSVLWRSPLVRTAVAASAVLAAVGAFLIYHLVSKPDPVPGSHGTTHARVTAPDAETDGNDHDSMSGLPVTARARLSPPTGAWPNRPPVGARRHDNRLRLNPGERLLRCGGAVALGSARASVILDNEKTAVMQLNAGRIHVRVPKLPSGGRVEVITPDARIRVKGTRFTVQRESESATTVAVSRGAVWVLPNGRNRKTIALAAGQRVTVLGEKAYLDQLRVRMGAALGEGRLEDAAGLGFLYLSTIARPETESDVSLKLAGILVRLRRFQQAILLYRRVASGAGHAVARQNALAFLARLYHHRGQKAEANETWHALVTRHPDGIYEREALMQLVRATCRKATEKGATYRQKLAKRFPNHAGAAALVRRCRP